MFIYDVLEGRKILKQINKIKIIFLLLSIFVFLISVSGVSADSTVYVNSTVGSDDNPGTSDLPYLTINKGISSVAENGTVNLADGIYSGEGNTNLTISKNMNIVGQSQQNTIINGTGTNWIFNVSSGVNLTIANLTLTNATAGTGGAIYNNGNLTVTNCTFMNNTGDCGGAIYNIGTLTVNDSTFTCNTANNGGVVYNAYNGSVNLSDSTFTGNIVNYNGGAIYNGGIIDSLSGSNFANNTANYYGGAIYNYGTITNINNCNFLNNTACDGGVIYNTGDRFTAGTINNMNNCIFTNNKAISYGGVIYNDHASFTLHFNKIAENTAAYGDDIYCGSGSELDAEYNWWGSNDSPSGKVIGAGVFKWMILTVNSTSNFIKGNSTSIITADLLHDNDGVYHDPASGHIPDGINVIFTTTLGTINSPASLINGVAQSTLNGGLTTSVASVSATADDQTSNISVTVDATLPVVTTIDPANNTNTNVTKKVITVTFSEPIQEGRAYDGISVTGPSGTFPITKDIHDNVLTLTLDSNCTDGNYGINIPVNAVEDYAGNSLSSVFTSSFTLDTVAPTANASIKTGSYNVTKTITLNMSESGTIYYTTNGTTPTASSKIYTTPIVIKSTTTLKFRAIDETGNKSPVYTEKYTIDRTAPKVTSTYPKNNAVGCSRTATITIKFSEKIKSGVNWSKIYIKNMNTGQKVFINSSINGNTLSIKMTYKRYPSNWYQVYIPDKAIKDYAGNNLATRYVFKFKTGK